MFLQLLRRIIGTEIWRDAIPGLAEISGAKEILGANVDRSILRRTDVNGRVPVEAELFLPVARKRLDRTALVRLSVDTRDFPALVFGVHVVLIGRIDEHPEPVAAVHVLPATVGNAARIFGVADPGAVVLQAAVDVIRPVVVQADVVEL